MTVNERLEVLLNKARETLADIPPSEKCNPEIIKNVIADEYGVYTPENALLYIADLASLIDRMELALEHVAGGDSE